MSRKRQEARRERERQRRQREQELAKRQAATFSQAAQQMSSAANAAGMTMQQMAAVFTPLPEPPGPTFSECVVGYRHWLLDPTGQLRAVTMTKQVWEPGVNTARCRPNDSPWGVFGFGFGGVVFGAREDESHPAPAKDCHCGLYGWNDHSADLGAGLDVDDNGRLVVLGAIAAWGDLRVHQKGFRAEHACVVALAIAPETSPRVHATLGRVAAEYRVPLVHIDMLQAEAEHHGTPLPADARPKPEVRQGPYLTTGITITTFGSST